MPPSPIRPATLRWIVAALILVIGIGWITASWLPQLRHDLATDACLARLTRLSAGLRLYAERHDGLLPPAARFVEAIGAAPDDLRCPAEVGPEPLHYAMNAAVSGAPLTSLDEETPLLFDARPRESTDGAGAADDLAEPRHRPIGELPQQAVALAGGRVRLLADDELRRRLSGPPDGDPR